MNVGRDRPPPLRPPQPAGRFGAPLALAAIAIATALATGCAGPRRTQPPPLPAPVAPAPVPAPVPPPPPPSPGYEQLREQLAGRDLHPLRGRRIAIDPGHGGAFRGALGPRGLAEAEVNLGVALRLRDLLLAAEARPLLTRDADRDFLTPADSSLASDLAARVAILNGAAADVVLSIHHNSTATRDTTVNGTDTYYPAGRDGADLDLARAIHRHLVRNLEISPARILPGNFRVLRESRAPAVLGEPAMISNPQMERRLGDAAKQELEAEAYFLGLLDYFAGGTPRWTHAYGDTLRGRPAAVAWRFRATVDTSDATVDTSGAAVDTSGAPGPAPGLDPASVSLTLDGVAQPVAIDPDGRGIRWQAGAPAPSGLHRLVLQGRNLAGRAAPASVLPWRIEPRAASASALFAPFAGATGSVDASREGLLLWALRDEGGRPVASRGAVVRAGGVPGLPLPSAPASGGVARVRPAAIPASATLCAADAAGDTVCCPVERSAWLLPPGAVPIVLRAAPEATGAAATDAVPGGGWRARLPLPAWLDAAPARLRDPAAPLLLREEGRPFWIEAPGALPLLGDAHGRGPWQPPEAPPPDTLAWRPLLPELIGAVLVIDPAGGGADADGPPGPSGTRGADLDLGVAQALATLWRGAGGRAVLTREDERWVAPEARLLRSVEENADLFVTLRRAAPGEPPFAARHHDTSQRGRRWAGLAARALAPLAREDSAAAGVAAGEGYLLRQTACPALEIALPAPATIALEDRLARPDHQAACARALFLAAAALLARDDLLGDAVDPAALIAARPDLFPPLREVVWAQFDGNLPWLPPRWSAAAESLSSLAPGLPLRGSEHTCEVRTNAGWRLIALRRAPGGWAGRVVAGAAPAAAPLQNSPEAGRP